MRQVLECEEDLKRQIQELRIEMDENRQSKKTSEITETEYFQNLQYQAEHLRQIVKGFSATSHD